MTTTTTGEAGGGPAPAAAAASPPQPALRTDAAIRCTVPSCSCDCFSPCSAQVRSCRCCGHGWVSHALDKLGHAFQQAEVVQPSIAFDVASLVLYGAQAVPVRLKILLDRLLSVLRRDEVLRVLHAFGWTHEDYARGYILQDGSGRALERWHLASRDEEPLVLQQFLRFGETRAAAQHLLAHRDLRRHNSGVGPLYRQLSSSVSSTQSVSPTVSPPVCTSPTVISPLNKLQNMHPYDYRHQDKDGPEALCSVNYVATPHSVPRTSLTAPAASSLISTCSSATTNHSSTYTTASSEPVSGNEDGSIATYSSDDEDAINLACSDSVFAAKKVRHLRKSANPMKRRWNPTVLATLATNPATGKKRVQCHVCLKTFCDKGALKIHFSAVHLREMHKCTVNGCNMMFSSRRSRNRHSANPNPKLHTPNYRRKINPHDGRAANPYPLIPPSGMVDFTNGLMSSFSSGPHDGDNSSSCSETEQHVAVRAVSAPLERRSENAVHNSTLEYDGLHLDEGTPLPLTKRYRREVDATGNICEEGIDLSMKDEKRPLTNSSDDDRLALVQQEGQTCSSNIKREKNRHDLDDDLIAKDNSSIATTHNSKPVISGEHFLNNHSDNLSSEPSDLSLKNNKNAKTNSHDPVSRGDVSITENHKIVNDERVLDLEFRSVRSDECIPSAKSVRKRKSLNPTKCPTASDDDLQYVSTDDSSSDTYIDRDAEESALMDSKSDFLSSDGSDSINDIDFEDKQSDIEKENRNSVRVSVNSSTLPPASSKVFESHNKLSTDEQAYHHHDKYNGFRLSDLERFRNEMVRNHYKDVGDDVSENPLRHLESLTLGAFSSDLLKSRMNHQHHGVVTSASSGVSYHAPGLGLASVTTTTATSNRAESSPPPEPVPPLICSSTLVHHPGHQHNSDTENSVSDQQLPLLPAYRDASVVGSVEIPVDKENPRRCTACGKIFQNHFGVKTHYQNVHLKLMHKCTVEGCNAAFPSKRSRDRHSANLNLHRKLLSTSSDKSSGSFFEKGVYPFHPETSVYRGEFLSRFYDPQSLPLGFAELYHNRLSAGEGGGGGPFVPPFASRLAMPGFHPAFLPHAPFPTSRCLQNEDHSERNSSVSSISDPSSPGRRSCSPRRSPCVRLDEDLSADSEGRFACTICEKKFHEAVVLREHYERFHTQALLQCKTDGCNKAFLSKKARSVHSDSSHKSIVVPAMT